MDISDGPLIQQNRARYASIAIDSRTRAANNVEVHSLLQSSDEPVFDLLLQMLSTFLDFDVSKKA